jgi:hypothetical protein
MLTPPNPPHDGDPAPPCTDDLADPRATGFLFRSGLVEDPSRARRTPAAG